MKILRFIPSPDVKKEHSTPRAMKAFLPRWFREAERDIVMPDGSELKGLKACVPFRDAMQTGYALTTPVDVIVRREDGEVKIYWDTDVLSKVVAQRPWESGATLPRLEGYEPNHLVWRTNWGVRLPRGWSMLVTHPLNRFDLPFMTFAAVVDGDKWWTWGNIPFYLKKDFEGVIPAGTPFVQLIPIKRKKWASVLDFVSTPKTAALGDRSFVEDALYEKSHWIKKEYTEKK